MFSSRLGSPEDLPHLLRLAYAGALPGSPLESEVKAQWEWLWKSGRLLSVAVLDLDRGTPVGFIAGTLLSKRFYEELVRTDQPFVNRRMTGRSHMADGPFPQGDELLDGTATLFFNYFAWDGLLPPTEAVVVRGVAANAYLDEHGGYPIARIAVEAIGTNLRRLAEQSGSRVVNAYSRWAAAHGQPDDARPYLLAIERDDALRTENHWYTRIFRYQPPRLGLGPLQRETLRLARRGITDQEIADSLCISVETVRKRWQGIYDRFYDRAPGVLAVASDGKRGVEKRRLVLAYLHERPEELRP